MSLESVKQVVSRTVLEKEYRELLFSNPEKALADYDLSKAEFASLAAMEREKFDATSNELEERISRAGFGIGFTGDSPLRPAEFNVGDSDLSSFFGVALTET